MSVALKKFLFLGLGLFLLTLSSCTTEKASFSFTSILLLVLGISAFFYYLQYNISKFKRTKNKSTFFSWKRFRLPISITSLIFFSVLIVNFTFEESYYNQSLNQILKSKKEPTSVMDELEAQLLHSHYKKHYVTDRLMELKELKDRIDPDLFWTLKANLEIENENIPAASYALKQVKSLSFPYSNFLKGLLAVSDGLSLTQKKELLFSEIQNKGALKQSYELLAQIGNQQDKSRLLALDPKVKFLPINLAITLALKNGDLGLYAISIFRYASREVTWLIFLGATFILLAWLLFFKHIDVFSPNSWLPIIAVLVFSFITTLLTLPFSLLLQSIHYSSNPIIASFFYYFINVGMVEELMKLIPLLAILFFTKQIKEPMDFILFSSTAALGFAYIENMIYFGRYDIGLMSTRGMQFGNGHLLFSGIIAYALALQKFKYKHWKFLPTLLIGFVLAALCHGIFDFILIIKFPIIIFYAYFLLCMHLWGSIINNCLNNSSFYSPDKVQKLAEIRYYLILGMISIVLFEYVLTASGDGYGVANELLLDSAISSVYYIYFLSVALGKFDIIKGFWGKISWPTSVGDLFFPEKGSNAFHIGHEIKIVANKSNHELFKYTPLRGLISGRKIVRGNKNWYLIKLNHQLPISTHHNHQLLIRFKYDDSNLELDNYIPVEIGLIKKEENASELLYRLKPRSMRIGFANLTKPSFSVL